MTKKFETKGNPIYTKIIMKNQIITGFALLLLASCGEGGSELEQKQQALDAKKMELSKLENEIKMLEAEVGELDTTNSVSEPIGILVAVQELELSNFNSFVEVNGTVEAKEMATISPEQGGQIRSIKVDEGDRVTKGQVLAQLNTSVIQANLEELDNGISLARTVYERQSRLWEQKIGSEIQYLEAKNNLENLEKKKATLQSQMAMSTVRAPFSGVVEMVHQEVGELGAPGQPLITLVDLGNMKVKADVSERYATAVKKGAIVNVDFPNLGTSVEAPIQTIGNVINPGNRSFAVEVNVPNEDGFLKPNGIATIRLKDFEADSALVVPAIAIGKDAKGDFIYTVSAEGSEEHANKTYITTGRSSGGNTMVLEGLNVGDKVVVKGFNEVANGDLVRIQG